MPGTTPVKKVGLSQAEEPAVQTPCKAPVHENELSPLEHLRTLTRDLLTASWGGSRSKTPVIHSLMELTVQ